MPAAVGSEGRAELNRPLDDSLAELRGASERLHWLSEHRLLGVAGMLSERGQMSRDLAVLAERLVSARPMVPDIQLANEVSVLCALRDNAVPALALKGCLLAHAVYPAPNRRWRADLDVLVAPEAVASARVTLTELGFRPLWTVPGGTPMDQESWLLGQGASRQVVDLHWDLRNHPVLRRRLSFAEQWAAAIELPSLGVGIKGQGPVHALLSAAMHWFDDLYNQPRPLGWLLDIDLLWRRLDSQSQAEMIDLAGERELAGLVAECLRMARAVFATPISTDAIESLAAVGGRQKPTRLIQAGRGPYRAWWFALNSEPGLAGKLHRLRASLLPPVAHLRERYPKGSRLGLPGLYLRRLIKRMRR